MPFNARHKNPNNDKTSRRKRRNLIFLSYFPQQAARRVTQGLTEYSKGARWFHLRPNDTHSSSKSFNKITSPQREAEISRGNRHSPFLQAVISHPRHWPRPAGACSVKPDPQQVTVWTVWGLVLSQGHHTGSHLLFRETQVHGYFLTSYRMIL